MLRKLVLKLHKPSPGVVLALVAVVLAMGGFAFAAIPDRHGVIHACYKKKKGSLRVVSSSRKCTRRERALAWNKRGPSSRGGSGRRGPRGLRGLRGRTGRTGPAGAPGKDGSARAFAEINGSEATGGNTVFDSKAKNVTDAQVTHPSTGLYCFNLSFAPANVVATANWVSAGSSVLAAASLSDSPSCAGTESASVTLFDAATNASKDGNVYVAFN
jgi:hypothetical protein